jgi:hypothetical protein
LIEAEYETLLNDVTEVFENEKDPTERNRKLRMLLQFRGYMTAGCEENWKVPEETAGRKARATKKATKAKKSKRG